MLLFNPSLVIDSQHLFITQGRKALQEVAPVFLNSIPYFCNNYMCTSYMHKCCDDFFSNHRV